jgi:hypothetical protein
VPRVVTFERPNSRLNALDIRSVNVLEARAQTYIGLSLGLALSNKSVKLIQRASCPLEVVDRNLAIFEDTG